MVLYRILCERMEELIQMLKDYKAPYDSTQPVAAMIIDENGDIIVRNFKTLNVPVKRNFGKKFGTNIGVLHAEQRVLEEAGERARGNILITTLEPCTWRKSGKSCSELIVKAGISKVVFGYPDPYHPICSENYLEENGVEVTNLKEYNEQIAKYTNAHIGEKRKKRINQLQEQGLAFNPKERERLYLKGLGKLGYDRPQSKRELARLLNSSD